ncbi:MAG TPA: tripartite tricarboxylate transporter substrate-binding protein [Burkholderiales bacterium]|nr:tripartite tricarboxylate transporter substrate-binding protein [Burkholderiales bacterium]
MSISFYRGVLAALLCLTGFCANGQVYPNRPVRIVVGFPPGGGSDILYRKLAERLQPRIGQPVIVENRPGAGAAIAAQAVVQAPRDGYTVYGAGTSMATFQIFNKGLSFDVQKDLAPIGEVAETAYAVIVNTKSPAKNMAEFVAWVKANPGKYNYGSPGGAVRLAMELLRETAGLDMVHIQYKGAADYGTALLSDEVQLIFDAASPHKANVEAGKERILAVTTASRLRGLPEVPTMAEAGFPSYVVVGWYGMLAPAGTPREVIQRLSTELGAIVNSAEYKEDTFKWTQGAYVPKFSTPDEFGRFIDSEIKRWAGVAERARVEN